MDTSHDQRIINRVLRGDANAYGILIDRYQKPVFNLMFRLSGSREDAADLAQETFIKAYENLERFRPGRRFLPWLYAIGLNHAKDFLRKDKLGQNPGLDSEQMVDLAGVHEQQERLCDRLDFKRLEQALGRMPISYREAVTLRYHEELSMQEIAEALQISVSAAKMRVSRGLEMLRQSLKRAGYEE